MLAIPVFDSAVFNTADEDFDYYGWTDNITFLKNSLLGNKAITSSPSQRKAYDNGDSKGSDNRGNYKRSASKTSTSLSSALENHSNRKFPARRPLTSSNTFFDKYSEPLACDLKFNSLRSGPFGITDPLISKLFANYTPKTERTDSETEETLMSTETGMLSGFDEPLLEDDLIYSHDVSGNFEELFAQDNSKHLITVKVQIPGEIQGAMHTSTMEKSIEIDNDLFWDMPYDGDMKTISINATLIRPEKRKQKRNPLLDNPVYEFPGNYHKARNSLIGSTTV